MKVVIQRKDLKTIFWQESARELGIEVVCLEGSAAWSFFQIVKISFMSCRPDVFVFRYLNDYKSFFKTMLRSFSELMTVMFCILFKIQIYWICHNVDKESLSYFPFLTNCRRRVIAKVAKRILVMDQFLVPYAKKKLSRSYGKIDSIAFGMPARTEGPCCDTAKKCEAFLKKQRGAAKKNNMIFMVFLTLGSPSTNKSIHFDYVKELIQAANNNGVWLCGIVGGDFGTDPLAQKRLAKIRSEEKICLFDKFVELPSKFILNNIDFYFRGYDDYSVPYSLYEAVGNYKPILSLNKGFLPVLVKKYGIGAIIDLDFSNLHLILDSLKKINKKKFEAFIKVNNWSRFAKALLRWSPK